MQMNHLYAVREFGDVFVDAAVRDELGELVFLSLYGRDTVILQFLCKTACKTFQISGVISVQKLPPWVV